MGMTWAYIAGFFDGEGNVRLVMGQGSACMQLSLHQSGDRGFRVLNEIAEFLAANGIQAAVAKRKELTKAKRRQRMYRMYVYYREGVIKFLNNVMPFLRVKRTESQDLIRYSKLFPLANGDVRFRNDLGPGEKCSRGHLLTDENSYQRVRRGRPQKDCKTCAKRRANNRYARLRAR